MRRRGCPGVRNTRVPSASILRDDAAYAINVLDPLLHCELVRSSAGYRCGRTSLNVTPHTSASRDIVHGPRYLHAMCGIH